MKSDNSVQDRISALPTELQKPRYLTEQEVSALTGISVQSLRNNRTLRRGFPYRKFGKSVRYYLPEIVAIMESHRIDPIDLIDPEAI